MTQGIIGTSKGAMVKMRMKDGESDKISGGHIPGADGQPAYELHRRQPSAVPILIAVPHAGRSYPEQLTRAMRFPREASLRLEDRFADLVAEQVARETGTALLVAHAPRAMIDLNRAPDDMDWEMVTGGGPTGAARLAAGRRARNGLGLVPRRLPGMGELWRRRMDPEDLSARIELVHKPYHNALAHTLEALRDRWGAALLIDMHSMPPLGAKTGASASPDFVIGDRFGASCASFLSTAAFDHFDAVGRRAGHNRPYAGGYVLDRHAAPARGMHAMQIEICRASYLDARLREPGEGLTGIARVLSGLVRRLADELAESAPGFAQAAE